MSPLSRSRSNSKSRLLRFRRHGCSRSCSRCRNPPSPPPQSPWRNQGNRRRSRSFSRSMTPPAYSRRENNRQRESRVITRGRSRSRTSSDNRKRERLSPCRCLGVFGLSPLTTQYKIREIFLKYGAIERIHVVTDAQTGRSRGFCFVYYANVADAEVARDNCCGLELDGRRIRVAYSTTERPHTPTPGLYRGQPVRMLRERNHRGQRNPSAASPARASSTRRRRYR